jgi:hypothetical protein
MAHWLRWLSTLCGGRKNCHRSQVEGGAAKASLRGMRVGCRAIDRSDSKGRQGEAQTKRGGRPHRFSPVRAAWPKTRPAYRLQHPCGACWIARCGAGGWRVDGHSVALYQQSRVGIGRAAHAHCLSRATSQVDSRRPSSRVSNTPHRNNRRSFPNTFSR